VGEDFDKMISSFSVLQGRLRGSTNKVKQLQVARMRQSTFHDAFSRTTKLINALIILFVSFMDN